MSFGDEIPLLYLQVLSIPACNWIDLHIIPGPAFDRLELTSIDERVSEYIPALLYDVGLSVRMLVLEDVRDEAWVDWLFEREPFKDVEIVLFKGKGARGQFNFADGLPAKVKVFYDVDDGVLQAEDAYAALEPRASHMEDESVNLVADSGVCPQAE